MKPFVAFVLAAFVVSVTAAQAAASVAWSLTSDLAVFATSGAATGGIVQQAGLTFRDITGSIGDGTSGLARWYTGDNWPDEDAPDPARYVQLAAAGTGGAAVTITEIAVTVNGGGTGNIRATLAYDTDPAFATVAILEDVAASRDVVGPFSYTVDVAVPDGDSRYVRVYPYLGGGNTSVTRFLLLQAMTVHGLAIDPATVAREETPLDAVLLLHRSAPIPMRSTATRRYGLAQAADVELVLLNVLGQRIATLASGPQAAGTHHGTVRADGLAGGVYLGRLTAGGVS